MAIQTWIFLAAHNAISNLLRIIIEATIQAVESVSEFQHGLLDVNDLFYYVNKSLQSAPLLAAAEMRLSSFVLTVSAPEGKCDNLVHRN